MSEHVSTEKASVAGQSFATAHRLNTLSKAPEQWQVQYGTWIQQPIHKGDVILARFYLRAIKGQAETGEARTQVAFGIGVPDWSKSMSQSDGIPTEWKQYNLPFVALFNSPANGSVMAFDLGYQPQSFEVGGIQLINYGSTRTVADLPRTRSEYAGEEEDAPWRKAARERIEKLRKGNLQVKMVDAEGKPVDAASVAVRMRRHAFAFGTCVAADRLMGTNADSQKYRQIILENYSAATAENHLKWPFWETRGSVSQTPSSCHRASRQGRKLSLFYRYTFRTLTVTRIRKSTAENAEVPESAYTQRVGPTLDGFLLSKLICRV